MSESAALLEHSYFVHVDGWEQGRYLAMAFLKPYTKGRLRAEDLGRFEWEKPERQSGGRVPTAEELAGVADWASKVMKGLSNE